MTVTIKFSDLTGSMQADDVKRLKELEHENSRLKRIVAASGPTFLSDAIKRWKVDLPISSSLELHDSHYSSRTNVVAALSNTTRGSGLNHRTGIQRWQ